ncbi:MAG: FAD-binding protein, partial [Saprospiraceae bacterium]|nr:FAD-binding protein [Saprospiraceae bacterium]
HMTDFTVRDGRVQSLQVNGTDVHDVQHLILATGHSARDIYQLFEAKGLLLHFKPFAVGVRIEHPQVLIDRIQYGRERGTHLPAASYRLACQVDGKGVFSFCMCPGGLVVPAATAPGEIVLNGMSLSKRDSPFANAGTVVSVDEAQVAGDRDAQGGISPLAGMRLQQRIEQACFQLGDGTQRAPAQRLIDFLEDRPGTDLPDCSYIPGIFEADLSSVFPADLVTTLREGIRQFGKTMHGYLTNDAVVMATESRTSAPVRIPRTPDRLEHPQISDLYPCGEGAGFAGGIISAALDGQRVAQVVATKLHKSHPAS